MKKTLNPSKLFDPRPYGFSQIVISEPGKLVFISGQVAWDEEMNIVGVNDLTLQVKKALSNLVVAIQSAGGKTENITALRIYKVGLTREDHPIISQALIETFGTINPPTSTWLSVNGLANDNLLIEIEAIAVI